VAVGADHAIFYVPAVGKGEMFGRRHAFQESFSGRSHRS